MKKMKKLLGFILLFAVFAIANNTKALAAEVQYSENVIPIMTSNTSPSGEASASSTYADYLAYKAFDQSYYTGGSASAWVSQMYTSTGWLKYTFSEQKCITKYTIVSRISASNLKELPKNWTFEAWDQQLNQWIILDTRTDVTDWEKSVIKEFTFTNNQYYNSYRINITANGGYSAYVVIGELEMMETVSGSANLNAVAGDSNVQLSWSSIENATSYNIKRSTTAGGPYTTIATSSAITYVDTDVTNGISYYYVVTAIVSGTESENSNEVSATPTVSTIPNPPTDFIGNKAIIKITMVTGEVKEYNLVITEIQNFIDWYDMRSEGMGKVYYIFTKENYQPYFSRKEYIVYDKITNFEIMDYNE